MPEARTESRDEQRRHRSLRWPLHSPRDEDENDCPHREGGHGGDSGQELYFGWP
jgi:hypothetical protein